MQTSIVIPVWNGADVITGCLDSVYDCVGDELLEVICVDNASVDGSAELIAGRYPGVRLIRQPVNLGFAGGINAGIDVAQGALFVLLNQDCVVHDGWLTGLIQALQENPQFGLAGCTILDSNGTLNHAGAVIGRPDAYGVHLTQSWGDQPARVDFVTGAALAIRRETWDRVGRFDEGFYPGYYEDSDYCYRARRKGIETAYVPQARVTHLFSSAELETDPVKYIASQHRSRYRFVSKHFDSREVSDFFAAEHAALEEERNLYHALGRVIAARQTLSGLPDILERRRLDLDDQISATHRRQLQAGFTRVLSRSFAVAERLSQVGLFEPPLEEWEAANQRLEEALSRPLTMVLPEPLEQRLEETLSRPPAIVPLELLEQQHAADQRLEEALSRPLAIVQHPEQAIASVLADQGEMVKQQLHALQQREHALLTRIHFRSPDDDRPESKLRRLFRLLVLRPLSFLIGRDYLLLSELNAVHVARLDLMDHRASLMDQRASLTDQRASLMDQRADLMDQRADLMDQRADQMDQRADLMDQRADQMNQRADLMLQEMQRMDQIYRTSLALIVQSYNTRIEQVHGLYHQKIEQGKSVDLYYREQLERRLKLLESLAQQP